MHRSSPASSTKGSSGGQKPREVGESQTREEEPKGQTSEQSESTTTCPLLQNLLIFGGYLNFSLIIRFKLTLRESTHTRWGSNCRQWHGKGLHQLSKQHATGGTTRGPVYRRHGSSQRSIRGAPGCWFGRAE